MAEKDPVPDGSAAGFGCAFIVEAPPGDAEGPAYCGRPCRPGSDFCEAHHALCHLRPGGAGESARRCRIEALADAVGGRRARPAAEPSPAWISRADRKAGSFFRQNRSRYVREQAMTDRATRNPVEQTAAASDGEGAPTPERQRHGPVERVARPISDAAGRPARPYRAVDTLAIMERRGSITAGMRQAGEDFRARFAVAHLDPLRAIDLHVRLGERGLRPEGEGPGLRIEAARSSVWRAVQAVGGMGSPAGSCLWHVLGWEQSLKEWALEQGWSGRRVSQEAAAGIMIAALGALESHFRIG